MSGVGIVILSSPPSQLKTQPIYNRPQLLGSPLSEVLFSGRKSDNTLCKVVPGTAVQKFDMVQRGRAISDLTGR